MSRRVSLTTDYGPRYEKTALPLSVITGIRSPDLTRCIASLRATMTYLTGSHAWDESLERALIEACMAALLHHSEHLEVS